MSLSTTVSKGKSIANFRIIYTLQLPESLREPESLRA